MGYQTGSVFIYDNKFWLFGGYGTVLNCNQFFILHGMNGRIVEALASECVHVCSPSEICFYDADVDSE